MSFASLAGARIPHALAGGGGGPILEDNFNAGTLTTGRVPDTAGSSTWEVDDAVSMLAVVSGAVESNRLQSEGVSEATSRSTYTLPDSYTDWQYDVFIASPIPTPSVAQDGGGTLTIFSIGVGLTQLDWRYGSSGSSTPEADSKARFSGATTNFTPPVSDTFFKFSLGSTATQLTYSVSSSADGATYTTLVSGVGAAVVAGDVWFELRGGFSIGNISNGGQNPAKVTRVLFTSP